MKSLKSIAVFAITCVGVIPFCMPVALHAQGPIKSALSYLNQGDSEDETPKPQTTSDKIQDLQKRYDSSYTEFSTLLNRLSTESNLLGSKELFSSVDTTDREMKKIRSSATTILNSLRLQSKNIQASKTFTDEQKQELVQAAEEHINTCNELSTKLDASVKQLATAYSLFPRWKTIHNSYLNLQGEEKAADQVKVQVDEFLNGFSSEPQEPAAEAQPPAEVQPPAEAQPPAEVQPAADDATEEVE